jgi:superfamily I DNA and/or RNA helicase
VILIIVWAPLCPYVARTILSKPGWRLGEFINDEASQVPLFTLSLSYLFPEMEKLVLVGDPEQLAPYGTDHNHTLNSTYEVVKRGVRPIFLDVNRRIPLPIAEVSSAISYSGRLNTHPTKNIPVGDCCKRFDVPGKEIKDGDSKSNPDEIEAIVKLIKTLPSHVLGDLTVLTMYKKQVNRLNNRFKEEKMNVYVVTADSYQGREAGTVILSLVSAAAPGFAKNKRRVNVSITRVQKVLYIVGHRQFWRKVDSVPAMKKLAEIASDLAWYIQNGTQGFYTSQ